MIKTKKIAAALYAHHVFTKGQEVDEMSHNLISFLKRHNMLSQLGNILVNLERISKKENSVNDCSITVSHEIKKEVIDNLTEKLLGVESKNTEIHVKLDPELIGGFVLKHDGVIYDGSIKTKLDLLEASLSA